MFQTSLFLTLLPVAIRAANDWNTPCFQGVCSYETPQNANLMAATMTIAGTPNAISDITTAAGWEIMGCDSNAMAQDIRLVCKSTDTSASGCDHLFNNGAEGTIVRLPENCGKSPFARVAKHWIPVDQSIPDSVAARLMKRDDATPPTVHALTLDTNFAAVGGSQDGNVTLAIQGSSIPGAGGNATVTPATSRRRSRRNLQGRGFGDFIKSALDTFKKLDSFNQTVSTNLPPVDINKSFPVFNTSVDCGSSKASININANAQAHAQISLGVVAAGTIVPPKISDFAVYTGLTANLDVTMTIDASATGSIDSGPITLFTAGLPGLDFPGILTVGPSFKLNTQAKANLDVELNMNVDLNYQVDKVQLFFPPNDHPSTGSLSPKDSPLKLSVSPNLSSKGSVEAHIIPTVDLGINALSGAASATIFLNVDASSTLTMSLDAQAAASVSTNGTKSASAGVNGCVDLAGGVNVQAGAQGSFLGIFSDSTTVPVFTKNFDLFKKCFGASASTPAKRAAFHEDATALVKRVGLTCPATGIGAAASLVDQTLAAASFASTS